MATGTELIRYQGDFGRLFTNFYIIDRSHNVRRAIDDWDYYFYCRFSRLLKWDRVAKTVIGGQRISTVFISLDQDHGMSWEWVRDEEGWPQPVLPPGYMPTCFETMVFGGPLHGYQERYKTWEQAVEGHREVVRLVTEGRGLEWWECPQCGMVTWHPDDICHRYCGGCHTFPEDRASKENTPMTPG